MVGDFFISQLDFATIRHFRKRLTLKEKGNLDAVKGGIMELLHQCSVFPGY